MVRYLFAAIVLIFLGLAIWLLFSAWHEAYQGASDTVKAATIAALGSVFALLFGRYFEQRREAKIRINAEKIEIYKSFYQFYFEIMNYEKIHGKQKSSQKIMTEMLDFHKEVIFWGSDEVVRAYLDFKDQLTEFSEKNNDSEGESDLAIRLAGVLKAVSRVLVAMRRDVGYSFTSISAKDLARLQLATDADTKKVFDYL